MRSAINKVLGAPAADACDLEYHEHGAPTGLSRIEQGASLASSAELGRVRVLFMVCVCHDYSTGFRRCKEA